jgi:hypothetical protein
VYSSFKKHQLITESWRRFLLEAEQSNIDAVSYVDNLLSGPDATHASGRPIPDGFSSLEETEETTASELSSLITPAFLADFLIKHEEVKMAETIYVGDILENPNMSEIEKAKHIAVYNSIILFTAGSVATVREPKRFDPARAFQISRRGKYTVKKSSEQDPDDTFRFAFPYILKPTKEMYLIANHVITTISTMQNVQAGLSDIHRGMALPRKIAEALKEGDIFNSHGPSSWTTDIVTAEDFADAREKKGMEEAVSVVFNVEKPSFGNDIHYLSQYSVEKEFLLGKPIKIVGKTIGKETGEKYYFTCEIA